MLATASCRHTLFVDNEFAYVPDVEFKEYGSDIFIEQDKIVQWVTLVALEFL
ncbi:hypothetical protein BDW66DRAFT_133071 [Aspergillus desertorum]